MQNQLKHVFLLIGSIKDFRHFMQRDTSHALHLLKQYQIGIDHSCYTYHGIFVSDYSGDGCLIRFSGSEQALLCAFALHREFKQTMSLDVPLYLMDQVPQKVQIDFTLLQAQIVVSLSFKERLAHPGMYRFDPVNLGDSIVPLFHIAEKNILEPAQIDGNGQIFGIGIHKYKKWIKTLSMVIVLVVGYALFATHLGPFKASKLDNAETFSTTSIAVLPFENRSEEQNSFLDDGMMENILTNLAKIKNLKVISRTSMMQYQETTKSIPQIAEELGVDYILEGSVHQQKDKVKVTVQLIDGDEDKNVWAETYQRELNNLFDLQSEVSRKIAIALNQSISTELAINMDREPTQNLDAYNLLLQARHLNSLRTKAALEESLKRVDKALALDPEYAEAFEERSHAYYLLSNFRFIDEKTGEQLAEQSALRSIELNPETDLAYGILACIYESQQNWQAAETSFRIALQKNSNNAIVNYWYSIFLRDQQRYQEAIHYGSIAMELDPLYPVIHSGHILTCMLADSLDMAKELLDKGQALFENFFSYQWNWGYYYLIKENYERALEHNRKALELNPGMQAVERTVIFCLGKLGRVKEVDTYIASHQRGTEEDLLGLMNAYAGLGRNKECIDVVRKLWKLGVVNSNFDGAKFKALKEDTYFVDLLDEMKRSEELMD